jgi:hypothetical protein
MQVGVQEEQQREVRVPRTVVVSLSLSLLPLSSL